MADITLERNTYNACMHLKRRVVYEHEREEKGEHGYIWGIFKGYLRDLRL